MSLSSPVDISVSSEAVLNCSYDGFGRCQQLIKYTRKIHCARTHTFSSFWMLRSLRYIVYFYHTFAGPDLVGLHSKMFQSSSQKNQAIKSNYQIKSVIGLTKGHCVYVCVYDVGVLTCQFDYMHVLCM